VVLPQQSTSTFCRIAHFVLVLLLSSWWPVNELDNEGRIIARLLDPLFILILLFLAIKVVLQRLLELL
jgi:uncharacterized protein YggT (Ycf19 family)